MKRLNPDTGKPFVRGDTRADGFLFRNYDSIKSKKTGLFFEVWLSPKVFAKNATTKNAASKKLAKQKAITSKGRATLLINSAKARCVKRNAGCVSISRDWVEDKITKGICELTGLPFDLEPHPKFRNNPYAPSLDRIDNENPNYSESNTRVVLVAVNTALSEFGLDIMALIFERLLRSPMR